MVFLWVYGFSFESALLFFLYVYICVFPLKSTSVSFHSVCGILIFFRICVYSYTDAERGDLHIGPARSCGGKFCFSPPLPLTLEED